MSWTRNQFPTYYSSLLSIQEGAYLRRPGMPGELDLQALASMVAPTCTDLGKFQHAGLQLCTLLSDQLVTMLQ